MKKLLLTFFTFLMVVCFAQTGAASVLYDWAFNIDGTVTTASAYYDTSGMPVSGALGAGDLGTLTYTTSVAGAHSFIAFFDYEIDEAANTYFNEYGAATGSLAADQSWEIDEPGWVFGDIYDNMQAGALDNFNNVAAGLEDDVSMAMGWNFTVEAGNTATIELILSLEEPSGFYLSHTDPDSLETIYFSSTLDLGGEAPIPEPSTILLFGLGLLGLAKVGRQKRL